MLSSTTVPVSYHERKWIDVEPGRFVKSCLKVSKLMIRLLRHDDTVPREDDGAAKFQDLASIYRSQFTSSSHWSLRTWLSFLQRGGGIKKRFQYCVDPSSPETLLYTFEQFKAILEENTLILHCRTTCCYRDDFAEHIYHVGSSHDLHSIIQSGLIPGGTVSRKGEACSVVHSRKSDVR